MTFADADFRAGAASIIRKLYNEGVKQWYGRLGRGSTSGKQPIRADEFLTRVPSLPEFPNNPAGSWEKVIQAVTRK
jgi:hypothetical protein